VISRRIYLRLTIIVISLIMALGTFTWSTARRAGAAQRGYSAGDTMAADIGPWLQTSGPEGGSVTALLINGADLFAGTGPSGVFRSTNQGQNWTAVSAGLGNVGILAFAASGNNVFAGAVNGVFRSTDQGQSWTAANSGLPGGTIGALAVSGANLFVAINTPEGLGRGRVFRSGDQGQSWTEAGAGLSGTIIRGIAVSGADLYAGGNFGQVFRSTDQGQNWAPASSGLPSTSIEDLAASGGNIFAATISNGVYRSTNQGQSWTAVNTGLTQMVTNALATSGGNLFVGTVRGVFRSTDQGQNWTAVDASLPSVQIISITASGDQVLAGAFGGGVFRSANRGDNWAAVNTGLIATEVTSFAMSSANLFAGVDPGGVFRSPDQGRSWKAVNNGLTGADRFIVALAASGADLFAATSLRNVYRSTDQGESWNSVSSGLPFATFRTLIVSGANLFLGTVSGVYRSTDRGQNWRQVALGLGNRDVGAFAVGDNNLYAGTRGAGAFVSTDQGDSWTEINSGLTNRTILSLAVSGANLFAGTSGGGVFRSTDQGQNWTAVNSGLTSLNVRSLAVSGANLLAGTSGDGVFQSADNGNTWTAANAGLTNQRVLSLIASGASTFAGTLGGGVFVSGASGVGAVASVSAASFSGLELAAESIAAAFGQGLATATEAATSVPLPTTLAGASVRVRDSAGTERAAPLFFASPGQINYLIPTGTANGTANVSVVRDETVIAAGATQIATVAPGLFAANASGQGVAAAIVFRRRADGSESFEPVAQFNQAQNRFVAAPIDLGPETDQVFLLLFGTGYRSRASLATVACNIGGVAAEVLFAGEAPGLIGLDQANVRLPRALTGRGEVDVSLTVDGRVANTVTVAFSGTPTCAYSISPSERGFSAGGGAGSVNVTAPNGCAWTATSNAAWLTINSGAAGSGSGVVNYSVAANTGASQRAGALTIAGQTFTVTQAAGVQAISVGQPVTGTLTTDDLTQMRSGGRAYFYDAYRFSVTSANTTVAIDLRSAQFDAEIILYREENNRLTQMATNDELGGLGDGDTENHNALLLTVIPVIGDYVIFATSSAFAPPGLGAYTLRLNTNVMQNLSYGANLANASISTTDIQTSAGDYLDAYWFAGQQGDEVEIKMSSFAFDSFLILQTSSGGPPVAFDDDGGGGGNALLRFRLPATGNYIIIATPFAKNLTGAYTLTLNKTG